MLMTSLPPHDVNMRVFFLPNNTATIPKTMGTRSGRIRTPLQPAPKNLDAEPGATCPPGQSEASESPWQQRRGARLQWPEPAGPQWNLEAPRFMRFPLLASRIPRLGSPGQAGRSWAGWTRHSVLTWLLSHRQLLQRMWEKRLLRVTKMSAWRGRTGGVKQGKVQPFPGGRLKLMILMAI